MTSNHPTKHLSYLHLAFITGMLATFAPTIQTSASALKWAHTKKEFAADFGAESKTITFHFSNESDTPINISDVRSSCGCIDTTLSAKNISPSQKGTLTAVFDLRNRKGIVAKHVVVVYEHQGKRNLQRLQITGNISSAIEIKPEHLFWTPKEAETQVTKTATISIAPESDYQVQDIKSSNAAFQVTLKAGNKNRDYSAIVSFIGNEHQANSKQEAAVFSLSVEPPLEIGQKAHFFAHIKPKSEQRLPPTSNEAATPIH